MYNLISTGILSILVAIFAIYMGIKEQGSILILLLFLISISCIISIVTSYKMFKDFQKIKERLEKLELLDTRNKLNTEYYKKLDEFQRNEKAILHDMKKHLRVIGTMANQSKCGDIESFVENLTGEINKNSMVDYTNSPVLNALLSDKVELLRKEEYKNIPLNINIDRAADFSFIDECDLVVIFGNALDNAIEASLKVSDPEIKVSAYNVYETESLFIEFENKFDGKIKKSSGNILSTKQDSKNHGIGIKNIQKAVEKYSGVMTVEAYNGSDTFSLSIILNRPI